LKNPFLLLNICKIIFEDLSPFFVCNSLFQTISCHCLICNVTLGDIVESSHNVFGQLKTSDSSRVSVFEKVGQILNRNLHTIDLHSEVVCGRCFNLLTEYEETKCKLQRIRLDLVTKFEITENKHKDPVKEVSQKQVELEDNYQKCDANHTLEHSDIPLLVITDEGKVVDRNGKEKEAPVKRKRIRTPVCTLITPADRNN